VIYLFVDPPKKTSTCDSFFHFKRSKLTNFVYCCLQTMKKRRITQPISNYIFMGQAPIKQYPEVRELTFVTISNKICLEIRYERMGTTETRLCDREDCAYSSKICCLQTSFSEYSVVTVRNFNLLFFQIQILKYINCYNYLFFVFARWVVMS